MDDSSQESRIETEINKNDEDQHYLLMEVINACKTLSMKLCEIQQRKIKALAQKRQRISVLIHWNLDTDQRSLSAT